MAITHALRSPRRLRYATLPQKHAPLCVVVIFYSRKVLRNEALAASPRLRNHAETTAALPVQELNRANTETELGRCVAQA